MKFAETESVSAAERMIREEVFMREQGFKNEFDKVDADPRTVHLTAYLDGAPAGCCRVFPGMAPGEWHIGRLAVLQPLRHRGIASALLAEAEKIIRNRGARRILLDAQCYARGLYEKYGWNVCGSIFSDEGTPHVPMMKELDNENKK
jgi:predicted GNAT family N-acyltransferase